MVAPVIGKPLSDFSPVQLLDNSPDIINGLTKAGVNVIPAPITTLSGLYNSHAGGLETQSLNTGTTYQPDFRPT